MSSSRAIQCKQLRPIPNFKTQRRCASNRPTSPNSTMPYQDFTVNNVLCNNVKVHKNMSNDDYTLTFAFGKECGLSGLLLSQISLAYGPSPGILNRSLSEFNTGSVRAPWFYQAKVNRHYTFNSASPGYSRIPVHISPGSYQLSDVCYNNIVLRAVVDVTFKNVKVVPELCCSTIVNSTMHDGIEIQDLRGLEVRFCSSSTPDCETFHLKYVTNDMNNFELNRHKMAQ